MKNLPAQNLATLSTSQPIGLSSRCWGDFGAIIPRVRAHHAAGADHVCLQALTADRPAAAARMTRSGGGAAG
ncbi:MAG: hypothetical protein E6J73_22345 [Deltaproteobacteria bacterium]|nr:MAG: hypothetical protein E6J73_22345 [Deltaproteobacteria bacterium]